MVCEKRQRHRRKGTVIPHDPKPWLPQYGPDRRGLDKVKEFTFHRCIGVLYPGRLDAVRWYAAHPQRLNSSTSGSNSALVSTIPCERLVNHIDDELSCLFDIAQVCLSPTLSLRRNTDHDTGWTRAHRSKETKRG